MYHQLIAVKLGESAFAYGFYYVVGGCLIPLIVSLAHIPDHK